MNHRWNMAWMSNYIPHKPWVWLLIQQCIMTSSNGNIFRVTGHLCGEFTGPRWIPAQRPVTRSFDVFFDLRLNKRLSKQSRGWWFEKPSRSLWRQRNGKNGCLGVSWSIPWMHLNQSDYFHYCTIRYPVTFLYNSTCYDQNYGYIILMRYMWGHGGIIEKRQQ